MLGNARGGRLFVCVLFSLLQIRWAGRLGVVSCGAGGVTAGVVRDPSGSALFLLRWGNSPSQGRGENKTGWCVTGTGPSSRVKALSAPTTLLFLANGAIVTRVNHRLDLWRHSLRRVGCGSKYTPLCLLDSASPGKLNSGA
ncbi:uncharacterized protein LOC129538210 isoform X2 [Moschus berezovskii]|uniref:uncharacterized protein LOC129538210 isoform X2 n=1 Tax=Moschus berezovskii TaxID=68408 RepID=UPI0024438F8A|nr:uncharacterized protein LOC129538210 isoform X2 [Moschus berezovskii]